MHLCENIRLQSGNNSIYTLEVSRSTMKLHIKKKSYDGYCVGQGWSILGS